MGLTPQQQAVANHKSGAALVEAGAGSGKTHTVLSFLENLIKSGIQPYRILATTFSVKAAEEMNKRAEKSFGRIGINISTLHSIGFRILKKYVEFTPFTEEPNVGKGMCSPTSIAEDIVQKTRSNGTPGMDWVKDSDIKELVSNVCKMKREMIEPDTDACIEWCIANCPAWSEKMVEFYSLFVDTQIRNNVIDFDDMILWAVKILRDHPEAREKAARFAWIVVDECQDSNPMQIAMLDYLTPDGKNIMWVGDSFQSIYSFTGASPVTTIYKFKERYPDGTVYLMEENFRCQAHIVALADKLVERMENPYKKGIRAIKPATSLPMFSHFDSVMDEALGVVKQITENLPKHGPRRYKDNAVLYRLNKQSRAIEDVLFKAAIPYVIHGGTSFYNRMEVRKLLAYLWCAHYPTKANDALWEIINIPSVKFHAPTRYLGQAFKTKVEQAARSHGGSYYKAMTEMGNGITPRQQEAIDDLRSLLQKIYHLEVNGRPATIAEKLEYANEQSFKPWMEHTFGKKDEEGEDRLDILKELMNASFEYGSDVKAFLTFIRQIQKNEEEKKNNPDFDGVKLMTIHRSKGLEWKNVWVIGWTQGVMPFVFSGDAPKEISEDAGICNIAEERRIAYVAVTRAAQNLFLSASAINHKGKDAIPSQFLMEMDLLKEEAA